MYHILNHYLNKTHSHNLKNDSCKKNTTSNIFDDLPSLKPAKATELQDKLESFLSMEWDLNVKDGLRWWVERKHLYPQLHRMALDYLSIPGKLLFFFVCNGMLIDYIYQPHQ